MELVCIDYLTLETSKGGFQNILVITYHFTRYAQAFPTRNQTARTTVEVLFNNCIVHYGFPLLIQSDQGANVESQLIKQLCSIAGIKKSRTTPYHPMGNDTTERFNITLLDMLGTLDPIKKTDWKLYVSLLVHAYNCTRHETTGHSPFFLMFGRHPRLPINMALDMDLQQDKKNLSSYISCLRKRLQESYNLASKNIKQRQRKQNTYLDTKVRGATIQIGDRVLFRQLAFEGKQKLADKWKNYVYIVHRQPNSDIPVFVLKKEDGRNLLQPITSLPIEQEKKPRRILPDTPTTGPRRHLHKTPVRKPQPVKSTDEATSSSDDSLFDYDFAANVVGPSFQETPVVSILHFAVPEAGARTDSVVNSQSDNEISDGEEK